jgi:hypothetical protein
MKPVSILKAEYVGDLSVKIVFSDNTTTIVDVGTFIKKHPHPQYNKYLEESNFKKFKIDLGNIVWGKNWDLIFPIEQLYKGKIA